MDGIGLDNMLGAEQLEKMFGEGNGTEETQEPNSGGENPETKENDETQETAEVDFSDLLGNQPESVGSGEHTEGNGETPESKEGPGTPQTNLFSSIAKATRDEGVFPDLSDDELKELIANVGYDKVHVDYTGDEACNVTIEDGMQIDLGSVVKGYTGSYIADFFREKGVKSGLINLGGNVECIGTKPDGNPWRVAIKSPFDDSKSGALGVIDASDIAVITSGGYERFFEENGERYWHIIDPKTGKPARSGLASVTVIGKDGTVCDGLSTALFVMGEKGAEEFYKKYGKGESGIEAFDLVMVTEDREVYVTEGVSATFTLTSEYEDLKITVIK